MRKFRKELKDVGEQQRVAQDASGLLLDDANLARKKASMF